MTSVRPKKRETFRHDNNRTYYEVLGIPPAAKLEEIHDSYRALAILHHPDKGGDEEKFKEANTAWGTLKDAEMRKRYDATLVLAGVLDCSACGGTGVRSKYVGTKFMKGLPCNHCKGSGREKRCRG